MELLCPSGDFESLKAAVYGGCNAVYLGGTKYSARAYASNFTLENMKETIEYAHLYGVKVYITINTLLKNNEIFDAYSYAVDMWNKGCDALIVQDPGLIYLLRKYNPEIELHASTQMTVHNYEGTSYASNVLGLKRTVLSRELSLNEIKKISQDFETEIFIHGALCISYSGKCLISSMLSGRSGNRGRCAQNCRMKYNLLNSENCSVFNGFILSPKDISSLDIIDNIRDTGTSSLKIEGRMKRKEYVFQAASDYRKRIDGLTVRDRNLAQIFNREGFSKAYFLGNDGKDMMAYNSPKNTGLLLGNVENGVVELREPLKLGDGVGNKSAGFFVTKMTDGKNRELKEAEVGMRITIYPRNYKNGDTLYKTADNLLLKNINKRLEEKYPYKLNVTINAFFKCGEKIRIISKHGDFVSEVISDFIFEKAQKMPLSIEKVEENLKKSGDTPFLIDQIIFDEFEEGFVPLSKLNELRRELLTNLENNIKIYSRDKSKAVTQKCIEFDLEESKFEGMKNIEVPLIGEGEDAKSEKLIAVASTIDQLRAIITEKSKNVIPAIYPFYRNKKYLSLKDLKELDESEVIYYLRLPEIIKEEFSNIVNLIKGLKNCRGLITDNFGIINVFKDKIIMIGDNKLNILNDYSKESFKALTFFNLSEELNETELRSFKSKDRYIFKIYGSDELMISEYCPIGSTVGGKCHGKECNQACVRDSYKLKDEKGEIFPINTDLFCRSYIFNGRVKDNLDRKKDLISIGYQNFRIDFIDENYEETLEVLRSFKNSENYKKDMSTRGHYKRGIE